MSLLHWINDGLLTIFFLVAFYSGALEPAFLAAGAVTVAALAMLFRPAPAARCDWAAPGSG